MAWQHEGKWYDFGDEGQVLEMAGPPNPHISASNPYGIDPSLLNSGLVTFNPATDGPSFEGVAVPMPERDVYVGGQTLQDYTGSVQQGAITAASGRPGGLIRNPQTGQDEHAYRVQIGNQTGILPKSLALQIDPNAQQWDIAPEQKEGFEGMIPYLIAAAVGGGIIAPWALAGGAAGAGGLVGSAISDSILSEMVGGGLGNFAGGGAGAFGAGGLESLAGDLGSNAFPIEGVTPGFTGTVGSGSGVTLGGDPSISGWDTPTPSYGTDSYITGTGGAEGSISGSGVTPGGGFTDGAGAGAGFNTKGGSLASLKSILDNGGSVDDWLTLGGAVLPGVISAYGSSQQADTRQGIADRARADRQPFLDKSLEWLNNPQGYAEGPGAATLNGVLRKLSATHGNPIGSPTALGIATEAGLADWRNAYTGAANIGLSGSDTRANLEMNAANAGNIWPALGDSVASVMTPKSSLEQLLKQAQSSGYKFSLS